MGHPEIIQDRCIRSISRFVNCRQCEDSCSKKAITWDKEVSKFIIRNEECDSCGLCITGCPAEAIILEDRPRWPVFNGSIYVICRQSIHNLEKPGGYCLYVPCVKDLGYRFLLVCYGMGMREIVVVGTDCSECDQQVPSIHEDGVSLANEILSVAKRDYIEIVCSKSLPALDSHQEVDNCRLCSRRDLFRTLIKRTKDLVPDTHPQDDQVIVESEDKKTEFIKILERLYEGEPLDSGSKLSTYKPYINYESCYGCMVCARLCPTGALTLKDDRGDVVLEIGPWRCNGCNACVDLCDIGAIDIRFQPGFYPQEMLIFTERACIQCNVAFLTLDSKQERCPACRKEKGRGFEVIRNISFNR